MMPPECMVCGSEEDCDLVYFKEEEKENSNQPHHPHNAAWFCKKHIDDAQKKKNLTLKEAF